MVSSGGGRYSQSVYHWYGLGAVAVIIKRKKRTARKVSKHTLPPQTHHSFNLSTSQWGRNGLICEYFRPPWRWCISLATGSGPGAQYNRGNTQLTWRLDERSFSLLNHYSVQDPNVSSRSLALSHYSPSFPCSDMFVSPLIFLTPSPCLLLSHSLIVSLSLTLMYSHSKTCFTELPKWYWQCNLQASCDQYNRKLLISCLSEL